MTEDCMRDFHFVMDRGMKEKLKSLDVFPDFKGLSWVIRKILMVLSPVIKREHVWGEQRMSKYMHVCDDPEEIREHVHVYIPGGMYRELKVLHQNLNVYSIAQLLRGFVCFFLEYVDVYRGEVIKELEIIFTRWLKEEEDSQLTPRKFMRQLWKLIQHLPEKKVPIALYDTHFSPFWVFLL